MNNNTNGGGCPGTNRQGEPCGHPEGWGTDNDTGPCKYHGGAGGTNDDGSSHEGNDFAAKAGAWADGFFEDFLTEQEQRRVREATEVLGSQAGAQEVGRHVASLALEQFRRTGDERFLRRFESICDKFSIAPADEVELSGEDGGPLDVVINREVVGEDDGD